MSNAWQRVHEHPITAAIITASAPVIAAVIALNGSGGPSAITSNGAPNGQSACNGAIITGSHNSFNCAPTVGAAATGADSSSDPKARIVALTGSRSEQGFVDAIVDRDTDISCRSSRMAIFRCNSATALENHSEALPAS
jgi:hypothetical protein